MSYLKKRAGLILFSLFLSLSYNLYFIFLLPEVKPEYLYYLDFLLAVCACLLGGADYLRQKKAREKKNRLLQMDMLIYSEFPKLEGFEIAKHDVEALQRQLQEQYDLNFDLQDYIARWCHEVKIPLSAVFLMTEKIEDGRLRDSIKEQLERISQQLNSALLGCKVQSSLFDIQIKAVSLDSCVKTSIRNNAFFLIKKQFRMEIAVEEVLVYTDKNWLVYILDQLIQNAVKYAKGSPVLKIWSVKTERQVLLYIEDHGEGIEAHDIRRIFEKGYTGSSHHNGKYKSTGMGLYMSARILDKLGHTISVESEKGCYTRFCISLTAR